MDSTISMSMDELNKSRQNDYVLEENEKKSTEAQMSPIIQPKGKKETWRCNYFDLMDRIRKTLDDADKLQQQKPHGIEEGASKIWCKCFKCGEKNWYRTGPFKTVDYVSCDFCGGDLCDVLGGIVENHRVFTRASE